MFSIRDCKVDLSSYTSNSQIARVLSEAWVRDAIFCPACGDGLSAAQNNSEACDFVCLSCAEEFELKSKSQKIGKKIVNGAYATLMKRVVSQNNPNLYVLQYDKINFSVKNFLVVPNYFFTQSIIEKRKPLSLTAQRAGWVGCNILIGQVPNLGKIHYIRNGEKQDKKNILSMWKNTKFLRDGLGENDKGWLFDTMNCIDLIGQKEFSLSDVYKFEDALQARHPSNNHIKDKLRQQLQILRDKNIIEFIARGTYRLIAAS